MTAEHLRTAAESLMSLGSKFGGLEDQIRASETVDRLAVSMRDVSSTDLQSLTLDDCKTLQESFGDSIALDVVAESLRLLSLHDVNDTSVIDRYYHDAGKCDSATVSVVIDKEKLAAHCGLDQSEHRVVVFLFRTAFIQLLKHTLKQPDELEEQLWKRSIDRKMVVVIDEDGLWLDGKFWAIVGIDQTDRMTQMATASENDIQNASNVFQQCKEAVRWDKPFLSLLTPSCFRLSGNDRPESEVARLAMAHWANACVLFTADRVQIQNRIVATFATERSRCQVLLFDEIPENIPRLFENILALGDVAEWAYDDKWGSDRLRMVQINVSRSLAYGEQPRPALSLVVQSHGLWDELDWHWKSFIAEEIDRFVEDERTLEDEVAQAVEAFDGQAAEMIKSLSGAMLAAVGVLIGSVIAAAFKGSFNATVFSIGIWSYVGYLVLFLAFTTWRTMS